MRRIFTSPYVHKYKTLKTLKRSLLTLVGSLTVLISTVWCRRRHNRSPEFLRVLQSLFFNKILPVDLPCTISRLRHHTGSESVNPMQYTQLLFLVYYVGEASYGATCVGPCPRTVPKSPAGSTIPSVPHPPEEWSPSAALVTDHLPDPRTTTPSQGRHREWKLKLEYFPLGCDVNSFRLRSSSVLYGQRRTFFFVVVYPADVFSVHTPSSEVPRQLRKSRHESAIRGHPALRDWSGRGRGKVDG